MCAVQWQETVHNVNNAVVILYLQLEGFSDLEIWKENIPSFNAPLFLAKT